MHASACTPTARRCPTWTGWLRISTTRSTSSWTVAEPEAPGHRFLRRWGMAQLSAKERAQLPDSAFAYIDSRGARRLPIHDAPHVRNALARFDQVAFEDDA